MWNRVSKALCDCREIPETPVFSDIRSYGSNIPEKCKRLQAVNYDYKYNGRHLDRGHLTPSATMNQNKYDIKMTFTLTNAAPQYHPFNARPWAAYERYVRDVATDKYPNESIYVVTGTNKSCAGNEWLNRGDAEKSLVLIPGYFWMAVCYPGGSNENYRKPWSFVIMQKNSPFETQTNTCSITTVNKFSNLYFSSDLMGRTCMDALDMGPVAKYICRQGVK